LIGSLKNQFSLKILPYLLYKASDGCQTPSHHRTLKFNKNHMKSNIFGWYLDTIEFGFYIGNLNFQLDSVTFNNLFYLDNDEMVMEMKMFVVYIDGNACIHIS